LPGEHPHQAARGNATKGGMNNWLRRLLRSDARSAARPAHPSADRASAEPVVGLAAWKPSVEIDVLFSRWLLCERLAAADAHDHIETALLTNLEAAALSGDVAALVPRVPAVVPQLLQILRDPSGSMSALSRELTQDPVLVAAVLKVANSPYFRPAKPIASIEQALLILGHDGLGHLLASVAFKPILSLQSGGVTRRGAPLVWDQSERCGVACHVLAPVAGVNAFEAFLGALLRNVGAIVMLRLLDRGGYARPDTYTSAFCRSFMTLERRFASDIGRQWSFPASVINAVAQYDPTGSVNGATTLGELLQTCERLSKARILFEAGQVALEDLALESHGPVSACFARLVKAPSD